MTEAALKARRNYQKERRQSMTAEALEARRIYQREYQKEYRKRLSNDPEYKEKQRAYHNEWQQRNPEKCKAYQDKYWQKKAEALGLTD